jgi:hypothetical protein
MIRRRAVALGLGPVALLAAAACAGPRPGARTGSPLAQPGLAPARPAPAEDVLFVIPPDTAAARMRGDPAFALPPVITVEAGQGIAVRNEDAAMHYFFSMPIAPGQTVRQVFDRPGTYGYSTILSCSIASAETLTVEVTAPHRRA